MQTADESNGNFLTTTVNLAHEKMPKKYQHGVIHIFGMYDTSGKKYHSRTLVRPPVWVPGVRIDPLHLLAGCRKR